MKRTVLATAAGITLAGVVGIGVAAAATGAGPGDRIGDVLAGLVSKGTINQEQADAVAAALGKAHAQSRQERDERHAERRAEVDTMLQDVLGLTRAQLMEQLRAGKSLKEVAGDKADELADAAVALVEKGTARAVADGRLTRAQADEMVSRAKERAAAWLAGEEVGAGRGLGMLLGRGMVGGMGGDGPGAGMGRGHGGPGHHGPGMDDDAGAAADASPSATA